MEEIIEIIEKQLKTTDHWAVALRNAGLAPITVADCPGNLKHHFVVFVVTYPGTR